VLNGSLPRLSIFHIRSVHLFSSHHKAVNRHIACLSMSAMLRPSCATFLVPPVPRTFATMELNRKTYRAVHQNTHPVLGLYKKMLLLVFVGRVRTESGPVQFRKSHVPRDWIPACVGDSKNLYYCPESLPAFVNRSVGTVLRVHKLSLDSAAEGFCFGFPGLIQETSHSKRLQQPAELAHSPTYLMLF
jgi:hypothetical protein